MIETKPLAPGMRCSARTVRVAASMTNKRSGLAPVMIKSPAAARGDAHKVAVIAAQTAHRQPINPLPIRGRDMLALLLILGKYARSFLGRSLISWEIRCRVRANRPRPRV